MQKIIFFILFVFLSSNLLFAQLDKMSKGNAQKAYESGDYQKAYEQYAALSEKKPSSKLNWSLAELAFMLKKYPEARALYSELSLEKKYGQAVFKLALTDKLLGNMVAAINGFDSFANRSVHKDYAYLKAFARREKLGAEMWFTDTVNKSEVRLEPLGPEVNSMFPESFPRFKNDHSLLFTGTLYGKITGRSFSQLYISNHESRQWMKSTPLSGDFNNLPFDIGMSCISPDGASLYFTVLSPAECGQKQSMIYRAVFENGSWNYPKALGQVINLAGSSNGDPFVTTATDGQEILYFSSNRPGSKGGYDLYVAYKTSTGEFDRVSNLGSVNSVRDEITPFYDKNKERLYFSSNGHIGLGGHDVFYANVLPAEGFGEVINMVSPVNSSLDDIGFSLSPDAYSAVLASNRQPEDKSNHDFSNYDIYAIQLKKPIWYVAPIVFEESDGKRSLSQNARIDVYAGFQPLGTSFADGSNRSLIEVPSMGSILVKASAAGFEEGSFKLIIDEQSADTLPVSIVMKKIPVIEPPKPVSLVGTVIGRVFFEYDRFHLTKTAPDTLASVVQFIKDHPEYIVEVGGHADDKGTDDYNMKLSIKRSLAVKRFFDVNMKDSSRTISVGYGETKPIAPNKTEDGRDNPDGRSKNRRVEFVVREKPKDQ